MSTGCGGDDAAGEPTAQPANTAATARVADADETPTAETSQRTDDEMETGTLSADGGVDRAGLSRAAPRRGVTISADVVGRTRPDEVPDPSLPPRR